MDTSTTFLSGHPREKPVLLSRFLPPLPEGIAASWLNNTLSPGSWVIDPFGASPQLAIDAARAGYRVLVIARNPIIRFLLQLYSNPPTENELQVALATLAAKHKGNERLEPYIINQYITECDQCGQNIIADAFIWERDSDSPYARIYHCPQCLDSGERDATVRDITRAKLFSSGGIYKARAVERILSPSDHERSQVDEIINAYLPRAMHILITLTNKVEGFSNSSPTENRPRLPTKLVLAGLILHALDKANTLWPHPIARERPRKVTIPPRFRENNIWLALEEAVSILASTEEPIPLTIWPELPLEGGGLVVFDGTLKDLEEDLTSSRPLNINFEGVVTTFPRPNQAFWSLSTLWAGWLWGRKSIEQYKHVLRRRRYDWAWHSNALFQVLKTLPTLLPNKAPFFGLIAEVEPGFVTSTLAALETAGFFLKAIALRADQKITQFNLSVITKDVDYGGHTSSQTTLSKAIEDSSINYIAARAEPVEYIQLYTAGLIPLINAKVNPRPANPSPIDRFNEIQDYLENVYSTSGSFKRYSASEKSLDIGEWWLAHDNLTDHNQISLRDQVETYIFQYLQKHSPCTLPEIDKAVCTNFQGLFTPDFNLVKVCAESYCGVESLDSNQLRIRPQDVQEVRNLDIMSIRSSLTMIGVSLGFVIQDESPLIWRDINGEPAYFFYILASATFGTIIFNNPHPASQSFIVLPGGRSQLTTYKLKSNSRLRHAVENGWRFLKFRHIRRLVDAPLFNRDNLDEQLAIDPLSEADPQMRLL